MSSITQTPTVDVHHDWVTTQLRPGRAVNKNVPSGPFDTLESFVTALKSIIAADLKATQPSCTTCELRIGINATVPLVRPNLGPYAEGGDQDLPARFKASAHHGLHATTTDGHPYAAIGDILGVDDDRERQSVQRAASRGIMQAIESVDGYKYSFNNTWAAKEERALRYSYICQDSMQNRDRHANSSPRTTKSIEGLRENARKPTYDCRGSVSMKFSHLQQRVVIIYRHFLVHCSVADRGKSKPSLTLNHDASQTAEQALKVRDAAAVASVAKPASFHSSQPIANPELSRPLKRKRHSVQSQRHSGPSGPMSLAELLKRSSGANVKQPVVERGAQATSSSGAAVAYELPSWQQPIRLDQNSQSSPTQPYPAPYTPSSNHSSTPTWAGQVSGRQNISKEMHRPLETPTPKEIPKPKAQGLFTTMKPIRTTLAPDEYSQPWIVPNTSSVKTAPMNATIHHAETPSAPSAMDDHTNPGYTQTTSGVVSPPHDSILSFAEWTRRGMAASAPLPEPSPLSEWSQQPAVAREESPDPWFPKRKE